MRRLSSKLFLACKLMTGLFFIAASGLYSLLYAAEEKPRVIQLLLGDYHFTPAELQLVVGQPVVLQLVNTDTFIPHNFTLEDAEHGLDVDEEVLAGDTVEVHLMPLWPGRHTFYCSNKLLFMDSHREKGMEGSLIVVPE
jgi:plastocyanin